MAGTEPQHVLDGYTVLDFTQVLAGPTVTRLMAEMGAEIIVGKCPSALRQSQHERSAEGGPRVNPVTLRQAQGDR